MDPTLTSESLYHWCSILRGIRKNHVSVSASFCLLEKLQDHLELCPPQEFCSGAALQPLSPCAAGDTLCACCDGWHAHQCQSCTGEGDLFFPWVPESITPLVILQEAHLSGSAVGCVPQLLRAVEGWVPWRGMKSLQAGTSVEWGAPSWMPVCWEASGNGPHMCWCLTHLRGADSMKVHGHAALGKQSGLWGTALLSTASWDLWKSSLLLPCLWGLGWVSRLLPPPSSLQLSWAECRECVAGVQLYTFAALHCNGHLCKALGLECQASLPLLFFF